MKKSFLKRIFLAVILQAVPFLSVNAALSTSTNPFQVSIPEMSPGFEFDVTGLWLRPVSNDLEYAVHTFPFPFPTPNWHVKSINPSYHFAYGLGMGYVFCHSGNDIQLHWTHLNSSDSASVSAGPDGQFVAPFYETGPRGGTIQQARGKVDFRYDVVDLDVGQFVNFGNHTLIRFFAGLSGARIKQNLISTFSDNFIPFSVRSNNFSQYTGFGPRFGINAKYDLCYGFGVVGQVSGSVLIGNMIARTRYNSSSSIGEALFGITNNKQAIGSDNTQQVVPGADVKLGVNYTYPFCKDSAVTIEGGYKASMYVNAIQEYNPVIVVAPIQTGTVFVATMGKSKSNFSVNGPYLNVNIKL